MSTVSERLSLPPAGWKYEENCKDSEILSSVFSPRLVFASHLSILRNATHFLNGK